MLYTTLIYIRLPETKIYQRNECFRKKYPDDSNNVPVKVSGWYNIAPSGHFNKFRWFPYSQERALTVVSDEDFEELLNLKNKDAKNTLIPESKTSSALSKELLILPDGKQIFQRIPTSFETWMLCQKKT